MSGMRTFFGAVAGFAALIAAMAGTVRGLQFSYASPTPAEYLGHLGGKGRFVPAGDLHYNGFHLQCGRFPTIFDPTLKDYGAAYFGFIMLNPERFEQMPLTLKRYAYSHECGHQYAGYDENAADCYAIRRGQAEGWLDAAAMDEICAFISRSKGDGEHALGTRRCEMMRQCFTQARSEQTHQRRLIRQFGRLTIQDNCPVPFGSGETCNRSGHKDLWGQVLKHLQMRVMRGDAQM